MQNVQPREGTQSLDDWCATEQLPEQLLYLCNGPALLILGHREGTQQWQFEPHWQGLLTVRLGLTVIAGAAQVCQLLAAGLIKLQFFIDQAFAVGEKPHAKGPLSSLIGPEAMMNDDFHLEQWYLGQALQREPEYLAFAQALRCGESYRLVSFLSNEGGMGGKMHLLAERYGVSVSHFRRLCRRALGSRSKTELREWRTARALLAVAEQPASLTEVALNHGYASSSHFSKEIRDFLGVMPSSLTDITRLSGKMRHS